MSKTGAVLAALFLGLALFQGARELFVADQPAQPQPEITETPTPTPTPETSPSASPALQPFPTFEGNPPEARSYESTKGVAAALEEKGIECTSLQFLDQGDPTLKEFSLCDPGAEERRFNIYFYESARNRASWLASMEQQKLPLPLVWGPNWIVVAGGDPMTAKARVRSIQGAIGGTIEDFSPKKKKG